MNPLPDNESNSPIATNCVVEPRQQASAERTDSGDRPRCRIMLVDDEDSVLSSLRRVLRREPYDLVFAHSGQEALNLLEDQPVELVVSDQRMPEMSGTDLLREVRQRWPDTVRIILSGYSAVNTIIEAINEGAIYKFLSKPWNDEEVKISIRRALEQNELARENKRMADEIALQNDQLTELNARLAQRAADATAGLQSIQGVQEAISCGIMTFDLSGLIVANNSLAGQLVASDEDLFGLMATEALPPHVYQAFFGDEPADRQLGEGQIEHEGRRLQWRMRPVKDAGQLRGTVVTIWEEVQC